MSAPTPDILLEARELGCERDCRFLFDQLSFQVKAGDLVYVSGPNGAGKTTLLRMLAGLFQNFEGKITRFCAPESLIYIGHLPGLKMTLTAEENLAWLAKLRGQPADTTSIRTALSLVGLKGFEDNLGESLSAGQKRRVALARLYLETSRLWILDEPFTALDARAVAQLEAHIQMHREDGGAVVMTSHQIMSCPDIREIPLGEENG